MGRDADGRRACQHLPISSAVDSAPPGTLRLVTAL